MRQVPHIFKKEFRTYFVSPIAYIVISIFLIVIGWFFFSTFFLINQASLRNFFALLPIIFAFGAIRKIRFPVPVRRRVYLK